MSKFCGKCGKPLNENGLCPNCDAEKQEETIIAETNVAATESSSVNITESQKNNVSKKEFKKQKRVEKKATKKAKKKEKWAVKTKKQKFCSIFSKFMACILALTIFVTAVSGTLVYFNIVDIPIVKTILTALGIKQEENKTDSSLVMSSYEDDKEEINEFQDMVDPANQYKVDPIDAEEYLNSTSNIISKTKADASSKVTTEKDITSDFRSRGFEQFGITAEYSISGEYKDAFEISGNSSDKHPMYQTFYFSANNQYWNILSINGVVAAIPLSYIEEYEPEVTPIITETDTIYSYDNITNTFFEIIPDGTETFVKNIGAINAQTLDQLTPEMIGGN